MAERKRKMTREEIMQLNSDYLNGCESEHKMNELFEYALELQKHEQEPCEDCISRKYLLDNCVVDKVTMPYVPVSKIENAPPVTPQTKMGQWVYEGEGSGYKKWHCSNCKMLVRNPKKPWYDFCPHCGQQKMQEVGK